MEKEEIIEKLASKGIITSNCYPKASFVKNGDIHVGLYKREMDDDFYFFNKYDSKIYQFPKPANIDDYAKDIFNNTTKYLVPLHQCKMIWEDKEYVDLPDLPFRDMTLRQYACIKLKEPKSGLDWLDLLIEEANKHDKTRVA